MKHRRGIARLALVALAVFIGICGTLPSRAQVGGKRGPGRFSNTPDTTLAWGPTHYVRTSAGTWTSFSESLIINNFDANRRYYFSISNGSGGQNRVAEVSLLLNGRELMKSSDVTTSVDSCIKVANPIARNLLQVSVRGATDSYIDLALRSTPDPAYLIWAEHTYTIPEIPEDVEPPYIPPSWSFNVSKTSSQSAPYMLILKNANPDAGTTVSASVQLNGSYVTTWIDLTGAAVFKRQVALNTGSNSVVLRLGGNSGDAATVAFSATDVTPPLVTLTRPSNGYLTDSTQVTFSGTVTDETPGTVRVNNQDPRTTPGSFADVVALSNDGQFLLNVHASNAAGYGTDVIRQVIRDTRAPTLTVSQPTTPTTSDSASFSISWIDSTTTTVTVDGDTVGTGTTGNLNRTVPLDLGPNGVYFKAMDPLGHTTSFKRYVFRKALSDSTAVDSGAALSAAGSLSTTEITSFLNRNKFLYTANQPLQTGVFPDSIIDTLAAVVHGKVTARDFGPLPNVTVSVLGHAWFGQTTTRADGRFDLLVNGGSTLIIRFNKPGYLEAQRPVLPLWNDDAVLDSVALIGKTSRRSVVDFSSPQVSRGRFQTDANGDRNLRMYFQQGTTAKVAGVAGDTASLTAVRSRATEYTVGSDGRSAMPGMLPPSSAYTYCVDLSLDEADSAATSTGTPYTRFTKPVACYVRNMLHLPVGTSIPAGSYDSKSGQWKAGKDGVTIRILDTSGATATIDSKGNGVADGQARLDSLGIDATELSRLAQQFAANDTIWRVTVDHFSTWDFNINLALVTAQQSPTAGRAGQPLGIVGEACTATGSIIECENRVLGERLPIVGSPFTLNYRSYRQPGDVAVRTLRIPVTGAAPPAGLQRVVVLLDVAGRRYRRDLSAAANQVATIDDWDGKDAFGRVIQGSVNALVQIGYQYASTYGASSGGSSLGDPASTGGSLGAPEGDRSVGRMTWVKRRVSLGAPSTGSDGLGGWTISPHHFYDMTGRGGLYFGDGSVQLGERNYPVIQLFAPNIQSTDVAIAPNGTVYAAAPNGIWVVGPLLNRQIAGGGTGFTDGAPATQVALVDPKQVTVGPDGSIYFVVTGGGRVCKVTPDGIIHSIAGTGETGQSPSGDGGPATQARFGSAVSIALGSDGSVFVGDASSPTATVRRIAPNGIIRRYAGTGTSGGTDIDTPGPATTIAISTPGGLCVDETGNLYIAQGGNRRVRKVAPDGTMTTVANGGDDGNFTPNDVAVGPDGALYIADGCNSGSFIAHVHRLDPDGTLSVIAGGGVNPDFLIPALGCVINCPQGIALDQSGNIFLAEAANGHVSRIAPDLPGSSGGEFAIPSQDGSEVYYFDLRGRHLRTRDALTGGVRYTFNYDGAGRLASVVDANNDVTTIQRDGSGKPTAIVAPYGQRTVLSTVTRSAGVFLATIADSANETFTLDPDNGGLLRTMKDPKNNTHTFTFASDGRLNVDADPAGGSQTLPSPTYSGFSRTVTRTTGLGRQSSYTVTDLFDGTRQRRILGPDLLLHYMSDSSDARQRTWSPQGATGTDSLVSEPRFGMLAPMVGRSNLMVASSGPLNGTLRTVRVLRSGTGNYGKESGFNPPFTSGQWRESTFVNERTPFVAAFDAASHQLTSTTPLGRHVVTTEDSIGRPLSVSIPAITPIQFTYDGHGRLTQLQQGGRLWQYGYDGHGRLSSITDPLSRVTGFGYDESDRVTAQTMPDSQLVAYAYDSNGNVGSITPPGRPAHTFDYTAVDLTQHYTPPDVGIGPTATTYTYNIDRQLTQVQRPDSVAVTLGYESGTGRLRTVTIPRGTTTLTYSSTTGQLATLSSPDSVTLTYGYDGPLPISETWSGPIAGHVDVTYDQDFRPVTQTVNGGSVIALRYDLDGLLVGAGVDSLHLSATTGLLDSTSLAGLTATSSQDYDSLGDLANLHYAWSGGSYLESLSRDGLGRIVARTEAISGDTTRTLTYVYTTAGRLKEVRRGGNVLEHYEYDANGNRTFATGASPADTASATYDAQDRMLRYKNTRYGYTANGELALKVNGADTTHYTYDELGNLMTVILPNHDRIDYLIDGQSRRVGRKLNGTIQRMWLYQDGLNPVAELDGQGNMIERYVYGSSDHVPDYMVKGGITYRLVTDHVGTVRLVVDGTSGAVVERIDYDAWGRVLIDTSPGFVLPSFVGGIVDPSTGLTRFGSRDYDPTVGRWTSKDRLKFSSGDANLYAYAYGDPLSNLDPSGLATYVGLYEGPLGQGHLGIGFSPTLTYGAYPAVPRIMQWPLMVGGSVPGKIVPDPRSKLQHMVRINTTPQQEKVIRAGLLRRMRDPKWRYTLEGKHCGDLVRDLLLEAGIWIDDSIVPNEEFDKIINRPR